MKIVIEGLICCSGSFSLTVIIDHVWRLGPSLPHGTNGAAAAIWEGPRTGL